MKTLRLLPFFLLLFAAFAQGRPNVVFILTDDHRWDALSAMGHPFLQTPHLDRLANEGILFENAFVTTSLCSPSRAIARTMSSRGTMELVRSNACDSLSSLLVAKIGMMRIE